MVSFQNELKTFNMHLKRKFSTA